MEMDAGGWNVLIATIEAIQAALNTSPRLTFKTSIFRKVHMNLNNV